MFCLRWSAARETKTTAEGNVLKTAAKFDHESGSTLKVRISVVDSVHGAEYSNEKSFVISVLDIDEAPAALSLL
jgi:hypothetical protein